MPTDIKSGTVVVTKTDPPKERVNLRLTERMARQMLATAPKYKPVYLIRAFKMESDFEVIMIGDSETTPMPYVGKGGDYITINDKGYIDVVDATAVESDFKRIPPRKPKGE